ncbi:MAG TPA: aminotransferase class I/II-fold pyridoxal phosphate-dependent enzyme [Candidatus Peribacteraceae bacterium]|nr:aminotransferase class I/II-fold pyridoxal phosphate-dependent enzyme [Candidatus Peribacteraceae bacterium]
MSVIHHTFGPFVNTRYLVASLRSIFSGSQSTEHLRTALQEHFGRSAFLFANGRDALWALLRAVELRSGEAIVIQGFTCAVLPNAIHAAGGTPVYADIDRATLNLTVDSVRSVLTPRTRAIICQHTFGIPADVIGLRKLCDKHQVLLIEDCAHIIADQKDSLIGKYGDAVLLSFGRDKAISGVSGGAILVQDNAQADRLQQIEQNAAELPRVQKLRFRLYPFIYWKAKLLWPLRLGKPYLKLMRILRVLPPVLTAEEKRGNHPPAIHRIPNASAALALYCLKRLTAINEHRRQLAARYRRAFPDALADSPAPQKMPLLLRNADEIVAALKRHEIYLDDGWRGAVVNPPSSDQERMGYTKGSCPVAERVAREVLSLPTHPTMTEQDADRLIMIIKRVSSTIAS